jgi:hypothetical protein
LETGLLGNVEAGLGRGGTSVVFESQERQADDSWPLGYLSPQIRLPAFPEATLATSMR